MSNQLSILNEREITPFFQPIVSLQTLQIIGYESLGRQVTAGQSHSLGAFFGDTSISGDVHLRVDRLLREQAIEKLSGTREDALLFINLRPSWIYRAWEDLRTPNTLVYLKRYGIDPKRIVIEITEDEFVGNLEVLTDILETYRAQGCTIAIDDIGSGFSNFDRIAVIQPNILKVDLDILKKSNSHRGYRAVMRSFSTLASQIGASLLVEGVETQEDLYIALKSGARYVQGFLLSKAVPEFLASNSFVSMLEETLGPFCEQQLKGFRNIPAIESLMSDLLPATPIVSSAHDADRLIEDLTAKLPDNCLRVYICQNNGKQLSSNFTKHFGSPWSKDPSFRNCNWIWRPYFLSSIAMMNAQRKGMLSAEYTDLETSEVMQTYSYPIGDGQYIFIDLLV